MAQAVIPQPQAPSLTLNRAKLRGDLAIRRAGRIALRITPWIGYLFLWLPILFLIVFSFNSSKTNAIWNGFTLDWYKLLLNSRFDLKTGFSTQLLLNALQNSLIVAASATVLSTLLGTMIAIGMERLTFRGRRLIDLLLYLPVVIPEVAMGLSLLIFFSVTFRSINQLTGWQLALSLITVIIGHVVFAMPFVAIVVRARLTGMSPSLEEAARDLGANEWQTFRRVTLPLLTPGIVSGALLALTLSLDDFVVTYFTAGVGSTTLPLFVNGMIKFGVNPSINAISTIVVVVSMSLVLFSLLLQRRRG